MYMLPTGDSFQTYRHMKIASEGDGETFIMQMEMKRKVAILTLGKTIVNIFCTQHGSIRIHKAVNNKHKGNNW